MIGMSKVVLAVVGAALLNLQHTTVAKEFRDYTVFAIQNDQDRTYLKALNNGEVCDRRGEVITSRNLDLQSSSYMWIYRLLLNGRTHLDIVGHDFKVNEVTMQDSAPNCYSALAEYEMTYINGDTFRIKNFHNKKCLTGNGIGEKVTWEHCQGIWRNSRNQFWNFIDLAKENLLHNGGK